MDTSTPDFSSTYVTPADTLTLIHAGSAMETPVVCLYHADCYDGLGAAWALRKRFPHAVCMEVNYKEDPPLSHIPAGAHVYVVDFCYDLERLHMLAAIAGELHIFDHHVGMAETLTAFNEQMQALGWHHTHRGVFDISVSGAKLTWQQLLPDTESPPIIEFISDRDLWNFELEESRAVMAGLGTYAMDLTLWTRLLPWSLGAEHELHRDAHLQAVDRLEREGLVAMRAQQVEIDRIIKLTQRRIYLDPLQREVPLLNVPRHLATEALTQLAAQEGLAVGYFDSPHYREFSLRRAPNGPDVCVIAKHYGGGGHSGAAGFRVPRDHPLAQI